MVRVRSCPTGQGSSSLFPVPLPTGKSVSRAAEKSSQNSYLAPMQCRIVRIKWIRAKLICSPHYIVLVMVARTSGAMST